MGDLNDHTINKLSDAIKAMAEALNAMRDAATAGMVSRTDLAETEARLAERIGGAWSIEDQQTLDGVLELARRKSIRLERIRIALSKLDAQSPKTA